ncbi:MAG TPA: cysteine--tRNA ligase [Rhodocyclaceae bacterium]|nr:cysteine--tRNA ligase [Rhodocyclaceae bacterium]
MLKIFNTLAREKQIFVPLRPGHVGMYVCGMTVYDYCHLGHARVMVVFDMVARWLRASGYCLTYVRNITDIEDKIIKRAQENGETIRSLTDRFIAAMNEDAAALGVIRPDYEPRATDYVEPMLEMIGRLERNGYAYIGANRDVYYSVRKFSGYGKLSGKSLADLRAGARVDVADSKHDPLDFVLWKQGKEDDPVEASWDSSWGKGRPGWHIECSAMGSTLLGRQFDIHGGGQDLQFPHHENEIAQSEGAMPQAEGCAHSYVNYWMHNGFVRVDAEKMSKSLGNFFTIREVLKNYDPEVVRFFILRAHYRSPLNYSDAHLEDARHALARLYTALKGHSGVASECDWSEAHAQRFKLAMDDDFNTPEAVAVLFDLASAINRGEVGLAAQLKALAGVLGLLQREAQAYLQGSVAAGGLSDAEIDAKVGARGTAKQARNFAEADRIRAELKAVGVVLEDSPQGTTWRRV